MKLTRFTFGEKGIFHALNLLEEIEILDIQDQADLEWAGRFFEEKLIIPEILSCREYADCNLISFFTPKGLIEFAEPIETFKQLFLLAEYAGFGLWQEIDIDSKSLDVTYQDNWQVVGHVTA